MTNDISEQYFNWMYHLVIPDSDASYRNLLRYLDSLEFQYTMAMDSNRESDGFDLRYRFGYENGYDNRTIAHDLDFRTCSVLEMMVALCVRCEDMMSDPDYGDRTPVWFHEMLTSLDILDMNDENFSADKVCEVVDIFSNRSYHRNGKGGLFTVKNPYHDLRRLEIWAQMNLYLQEL